MGRIAKSVMYGLIFAVVFVWLFLLMSRHANRGPIALSGNRRPSSEGVNRSTEPFGVKANDVLGIRLGMALYDYRRGRRNHSVDCSKEDADTQVLCIGSQLNRHEPKLTVGGVDVEHYSLRFYEQRLIDIRYELVSSSWDSLKESLQDKFGPPAKHGELWEWRNGVSSLLLDRMTNDPTAGALEMQLNRETNEWLERSRRRQDAEAKRDL